MQVGGDERDDLFLVDLLVCFFAEALPRLCKMLDAMRQYRQQHRHQQQQQQGGGGGGGTSSSSSSNSNIDLAPLTQFSVEVVMKDQAHAMKGSAANIRLRRLAKVSV